MRRPNVNSGASTDAEAVNGWLSGDEVVRQVRLGRIKISPFAAKNVNPNSYNYRLHPIIRRLTNQIIDMKAPDQFENIVIPDDGLILYPDECYLGCTLEKFGSDYYAALITGRSSVGRKFVTNHVTAGLIDQGFYGRITLEITVKRPTRVYPNIAFGQIFWFTSVGKAILYNGKYHHQDYALGSRAHLDAQD
jgi:dCTP deaminase